MSAIRRTDPAARQELALRASLARVVRAKNFAVETTGWGVVPLRIKEGEKGEGLTPSPPPQVVVSDNSFSLTSNLFFISQSAFFRIERGS